MPTVDVFDQKNKKVGSAQLSDEVFGAKVNRSLVHQVLVAQLAARRQGTAKTKTRSEVQGGGKKPYKQKGTGNARHGSTRSPIFVTGATTFGPVPRKYDQKTPKKMVQGALKSVLSDRLASKRMIVVDKFDFKAPKTKELDGALKKAFKVEKALIVDNENLNLERSARNLKDSKSVRSNAINVYDVLKHEWLILSKGAAEAIQDRLTGKGAKA